VTTIGFIGSGHLGGALARLAADAGYDVVLSNRRGPDTLANLVDEIGVRARAATIAEAARDGDIVVVAVPLTAFSELPVAELAGKVVVDTCNYYPQRDGHIPVLDEETTTSSELLAALLPGAHVVKAFNNIAWVHLPMLARAPGDPERSALPVAGDDDTPEGAAAKRTVIELVERLGFHAHDVGPLAEGWRFQRDTPAYAAPYDPDGLSTWPPQRGRQVTAAELIELLAAAKRSRDM
jgi:predicted dinucleotide-binding enzyme